MAALVNLGLLLLLGVLQVSAGEYKDIEIGKQECGVKCFEKLPALLAYEKADLFFKDQLAVKEKVIYVIQELYTAAEQCCGKESEDKKCLEGKVYDIILNLVAVLSEYHDVYRHPLAQTIVNISLLATYAENELDCCCKLESCVQKIEIPVSSFKGGIKECKGENCGRRLNQLLQKIYEYAILVSDARYLQERALTIKASLEKYKELVSKDGKCKEEKELAELRKHLHSYVLTVNLLYTVQSVVNSLTGQMLHYASSAAREILLCNIEKEAKQVYPCY